MIAITVYREVVPRPLPRIVILKTSLLRMSYVDKIFGTVVSATDLPNREMIGLSDPFCIVRAVMLSGKAFQSSFSEQDQPLLLLFDLWDEDDPNKRLEEGGAQHLGSCTAAKCRRASTTEETALAPGCQPAS